MPEAIDFDPLERLESLLDRIQEAKDRHRLGDALDTAIRAVNGAGPAIARLENLAGFAPLVVDFLESSDLDQGRRLLGAVREIGQQLARASDLEALQDGAIQVSQLQGQINQADGLLLRGWKTKIDEAFSATGRLGGVLREIPEIRQLGSEMEEVIHRAERLASSLDDAERSVEEFAALAREQGRTKNKLTELGAGDGVINFLLAVAERSGTLLNVTADVQTWLDERHALSRFKVGL